MATSNKNFKVKNGLDVSGTATAESFVKTGGSAAQFLMADGSISDGAGSLEVSPTPPESPSEGDIWYNSTTGQTFVYYDSYWVENVTGQVGPQGPTGATGPAGQDSTVPGPQGPPGADGFIGADGAEGPPGPEGPQGPQGPEGPAGTFGVFDNAPVSPNEGEVWFNTSDARFYVYYDNFWVEALSNEAGPAGPEGPQGPAGADGLDGATGPEGPQGPQGIQGEVGPAGADGADALWNFVGAYGSGAAYAIGDVVTYEGQTWYRIDANGGNVGDTPAEGTFWTLIAAEGAEGPQGPAGADSTVPGPEGPQGPAGADGADGATGPGVAAGGTTGQILAKSSSTDYATEWVTRANSGAATMGFQLLTTTYENYITIDMTCSGRPVVVAFSALHQNSNSGANRSVNFRARLDGVTVGYELGGIFSLLLSGGGAPSSDGATFIITPTAGVRTFTFQASASANSSCVILAAQLSVFEI